MADYLKTLIKDPDIIRRVKKKMPALFQLAEINSSRAGKIGMEIGSVRERILIALLIYKFGRENVSTDVPITKTETDAILFEKPISIKTITGNLAGVKLMWTVDAKKAIEFSESYYPIVDLLLVQIKWGGIGWFYYFPITSQITVFDQLKKEKYIKLPKAGTNPRGVEITKEALELLVKHADTQKIEIKWERVNSNQNAYDRWVELWSN